MNTAEELRAATAATESGHIPSPAPDAADAVPEAAPEAPAPADRTDGPGEDEPIAESRFTLTRPLFLEGMGLTWSRGAGKSIRWLMAVLAALWAVIAVLALVKGQGLATPLVELLVLILVLLWSLVWLPRSRAKRAWQAMEDQGRTEGERSVRFYADHLEAESGGSVKRLDYSELQQLLESRRLLVLVSADRTGVIVAREGFVRSSAEEALAAIRRSA